MNMIVKHLLAWDDISSKGSLSLMKVPFYGSMHKTGSRLQIIVVGNRDTVKQQVASLIEAAAQKPVEDRLLDPEAETQLFTSMQTDRDCQMEMAKLDTLLPDRGCRAVSMVKAKIADNIKKQHPWVPLPNPVVVEAPPVSPVGLPAPQPSLLRRLFYKVWG